MLKAASRLPVSWIVAGQNLLILACMTAAFAVFLIGLEQVKVNGPYYVRIKDAADLTSDILPPPLYALETYLTVYQLARAKSRDEIAMLETRLSRLRQDFDARVAYWNTRALPRNVQDILAQESSPAAHRMFAVIDVKFLPAVRARDSAATNAALEEITGLYEKHREAVDRLVRATGQTLRAAEDAAGQTEFSVKKLIYTYMALAVLAAIAGVMLLFGANVRPLQKIMESLGALAKGDGDIVIGDTAGKGEIPRMWRAVSALRGAVIEALRLKKTLDEMPTNVMVADPKSGLVTYINNATLKTLSIGPTGDTPSMRGGLGEEVVPQQTVIDAHEAQRALIAPSSRTPWHTRIKVGAETLSLRVDAIMGRDNRYLAPLLTWEISRDESGARFASSVGQGDIRQEGGGGAEALDRLSAAATRIGAIAQSLNDVARRGNALALNAAIASREGDETGAGDTEEREKLSDLTKESGDLVESVTRLIETFRARA